MKNFENVNLSDALSMAFVGDTLELVNGDGLMLEEIVICEDIHSGAKSIDGINLQQITHKGWRRKKDEPKVLTAGQVRDGLTYTYENTYAAFIDGHKIGHQNGRPERDLELRPVIDKVMRYMEEPGCNDFSMVIENLKPLTSE